MKSWYRTLAGEWRDTFVMDSSRYWLANMRALPLWGWYGDWVCVGCQAPQLGTKPWGEDRFRCVACGPGDGLAPCPADHQGNKKACPLCRGAGFVEAL